MRVLLLLIVPAFCYAAESRVWSDATGSFSVKAELVEDGGDTVTLKTADGRNVTVPLSKLSEQDRTHLAKLRRERWASMPESERPSLGFSGVPIDPEILGALRQANVSPPPFRAGLLVREINEGASVYAAGIRQLDLLCKIDGQIVSSPEVIDDWLLKAKVGETYTVQILRISGKQIKGQRTWERMDLQMLVRSSEQAKAAAAACPLELMAASMGADVLGSRTVYITAKNNSTKAVVAYSGTIYCFNRFDEPVKGFLDDSNRQPVICQWTIEPGTSQRTKFTLLFRDTAAKVKVVVERIRIDDGSEWSADGEGGVSIWAESDR